MSKIERVKQIVKEILENNPDQSLAHRWDHIERVYNISLKIAEKYRDSVDLEILQLAALLHDIGQPYDNKKEHQKISAMKAYHILSELGYPERIIEKVCRIILEHSSENDLNRTQPSSLESKILFDADKIDGAGAVGIARALILFGQQGKSIEECLKWYQGKIEKTLPHLQTEEGRKLALKRLKFVEEFFKELSEETKLNDVEI